MMESLRSLAGQPVSRTRVRIFLTTLAACGLALFASTWKLWAPQDVYPQVPVLAWFEGTPAVAEWIPFALVMVSLLVVGAGALVAQRVPGEGAGAIRSAALLTFAASTIVLFLIDQHRLQPWAYQLVIFSIVLAALPIQRAFVLLRWIVVSIYFWSAVAKFDFSFLDSQGHQFLVAGLGLFGMSAESWPPAMRNIAALSFPLAELAIAVGLSFPLHRWTYLRRVVLTLAVLTHALLILVLSPVGLNHHPAVIVWNIWFIAQALLLFGFSEVERTEPPDPPTDPPFWRDLAGAVVEFLVAAVIFLPALNLVQRYDHWLAWGLYAPRNPRATLYVQESSAGRLPQTLRKHLSPNVSEEGWRQLRIDLWSLHALSVPIYPQDRFQIGVAEAVIHEHGLQDDFQLIVESPADRLTGRRIRTVIRKLGELKTYQRRYLLNSAPRK